VSDKKTTRGENEKHFLLQAVSSG